MAHKKGQGSTRNGRDSNPQFRGVKMYGGEFAQSGAIIVRHQAVHTQDSERHTRRYRLNVTRVKDC